VQVCTAAMHYGFSIVEDLVDGLSNWMDDKNYPSMSGFRRRAVPNYVRWEDLNLNFRTVASIDQNLCIGCGLCHIGCEDTSHQAISATRLGDKNRYEVIDEACVGCNLCHLVCPVEGCITMVPQPSLSSPLTWSDHPSNPRCGSCASE
jgi:dihydropyrimidine dehydrogenase (NAD+) subunit PreA